MKYMFASDIHGSAYYCRQVLETYRQSGAQRLILLGDLLYHGPRNALPRDYAPWEVFEMLNKHKNQIYAVRGNCDSEVDQMVLEFPIMADYAVLSLNGLTFFVTHGHLFDIERRPPMKPLDILIHGHTHVPVAEPVDDVFWLNPGSASLPKDGYPPTYGMLSGTRFEILDFDGRVVKELVLEGK